MVDAGERARIGIGCVVAAIGAFTTSPACSKGDPLEATYEPISIAPVEQALCHKLVECGCGEAFADFGLVQPVSCDGWTLGDLFQAGEGGYYGYGYEGGYGYGDYEPVFDEACMERFADRIDELDCDLRLSAFPEDCRDFCWPVIGPRWLGEPCELQTECGRGLLCSLGECRDPCTAGVATAGGQCNTRADCDRDTQVCTADVEGVPGVCRELPFAGAECYFGECMPGLRCNDDDRCAPLTADGEPCMGHRECASVYCPAGYCRSRPEVGEACGPDGACAEGAECLYTDDGDRGVCTASSAHCVELVDTVIELVLDSPGF